MRWSEFGEAADVWAKIALIEERVHRDHYELVESVDSSTLEYVKGLAFLCVNSPNINEKYIGVLLIITPGNRCGLLETIQDIQILDILPKEYRVRYSDGTISGWPNQHLTDSIYVHSFLFDSNDNLDQFKSAMALKFIDINWNK